MWDNNSPLQLLNSMPRELTKENLEKLQLIIDADKYKNSLISGFDVCGTYAPFCNNCNKSNVYPCATAYINMMRESGMDVEIGEQPVETIPQTVSEPTDTADKAIDEVEYTFNDDSWGAENIVSENMEETPAVTEDVTNEESLNIEEEPLKRKIRIAIARRKF